mmetsp:Transcript_2979/g.9622  ORF Transcript_2979/g.9622 Transcript_2979/m.9622 type:complete len:225 (+) Transcript_2979:78-752(+)
MPCLLRHCPGGEEQRSWPFWAASSRGKVPAVRVGLLGVRLRPLARLAQRGVLAPGNPHGDHPAGRLMPVPDLRTPGNSASVASAGVQSRQAGTWPLLKPLARFRRQALTLDCFRSKLMRCSRLAREEASLCRFSSAACISLTDISMSACRCSMRPCRLSVRLMVWARLLAISELRRCTSASTKSRTSQVTLEPEPSKALAVTAAAAATASASEALRSTAESSVS